MLGVFGMNWHLQLAGISKTTEYNIFDFIDCVIFVKGCCSSHKNLMRVIALCVNYFKIFTTHPGFVALY
jgi:hypothetical protein